MENAFKHAKFVQSAPVSIYIKTAVEDNWLSFTIRNNYNKEQSAQPNGIGLTNVKRRLEVLYPHGQHQLTSLKTNFLYSLP
jgi:LytS/YehU family sensor histidine kinase